MTDPAGEQRSAARAILIGGAIAGVLDIIFAFVFYGLKFDLSPVRILQSVASGLLGKEASSGGLPAAALGAFLQLVIPTGAAAVYYGGSRFARVLVEKPVLCGLLYGIVVYAVMNFVVVPLSAIHRKPSFAPGLLVPALIAHMVLVGLPIALAARRYGK